MTYHTYALRSKKDNRIYVGMSDNPMRRLKEHNSGQVFSTKGYRPWKMIYCQLVGERQSARNEEKKLKSGYGKEFLKNISKQIPG